MTIKPPIVVDSFGDMLVFDSVEKAERYVEPPDVENNEFVAYDGEGRLLRFIVARTGRRPSDLDRVVLQSAEQAPTHSTELQRKLVGFLAYLNVPQDWLSRASLQELVQKALEYKTE